MSIAGQVDPQNYQQQLNQKKQHIQQQFSEFNLPDIEVFDSPPSHYRMRVEFRIWHQDDDLFYAMFQPGDKSTPIRIDDCPMAHHSIEQLMPKLLAAIKPHAVLRHKLFQIDFLSTLSGDMLVSLLYHKKLDEAWREAADQLRQQLGIHLLGRARKTKICLEHDYVIEQLTLRDKTLRYQQVENSFTQPNAHVNQKMLQWACDISQSLQGDLLELYCGNGNFTLALADYFDKVLATEISKSSVHSARYNMQLNQIDNIEMLRVSSEEFTQAINGEREMRRLAHIDFNDYDIQTVLVDPPRAGLDQGTVDLVQRYHNIIYISCNPETLADNLRQLTQTHEIQKFAIFDQFPYTHHIESGVLLTRRSEV